MNGANGCIGTIDPVIRSLNLRMRRVVCPGVLRLGA